MFFSLAILIIVLIRAGRAFDAFVRYEYENAPVQWNKDGQPRGYFWKPPSQSRNSHKNISLGHPSVSAFKLLFITPKWVKPDTEAAGYLKRARQFALYWNVGILLWLVLFFARTGALTLKAFM